MDSNGAQDDTDDAMGLRTRTILAWMVAYPNRSRKDSVETHQVAWFGWQARHQDFNGGLNNDGGYDELICGPRQPRHGNCILQSITEKDSVNIAFGIGVAGSSPT